MLKSHIIRTLWAAVVLALMVVFGDCVVVSADGVSETKKERTQQQQHLMSTGETPAEYMERKIKSHEVSSFVRS
jgi:flagellar biosynthesis protein FliP